MTLEVLHNLEPAPKDKYFNEECDLKRQGEGQVTKEAGEPGLRCVLKLTTDTVDKLFKLLVCLKRHIKHI